MQEHNVHFTGAKLAGYSWLIHKFRLNVLPNWHRSLVASGNTHRIDGADGVIEEVYPARYWPGNTVGDHLQFALKYDGTNPAILASVFESASKSEIQQYIELAPRGKYTRRIWFLYEMLTGEQLSLPDLKTGGYIDLLDPDAYYTVKEPQKVRRQRINENLLGDVRFCPMIRRTERLRAFEASNLPERCRSLMAQYKPELLRRAMNYLYTKETKSSFEIENIKPTSTRTERFVTMLHLAEKQDFCAKARLIELQNRIVDPRFRDTDYRDTQNYVGETVAWQNEKVHFAAPRPQDLDELMEGMIGAHNRMETGQVFSVIHAVAVSYGFVFLHPFEDGNGRIHRFLVHNILARRAFTPTGLIFPVSAAMLRNMADYDASLEAFSKPLMALVEYVLDEVGRMTVQNDTAIWYKYIDMTPQAESLAKFIEQTIDVELAGELAFLANYDETKKAIQSIVDMPDRKIDLFIRFCLQNNGSLSARKRTSHFDFLSDKEVARIEQAIRCAYENSK